MAYNTTSISVEEAIPKILQIVLLLILSALASAGHILVILAIYQRRELRAGTYLIILNLSIADLLYATIFLPLEVRGMFSPSLHNCEIRGIIGTMFILVSMNMLTFVSFERFMATNYPFRHRQWFTTKVINTGITFVWLWCALFTIWPIVTSGYGFEENFSHCTVKWRNNKLTTMFLILFHGILPPVVLAYCNIKIVLVVRKRASIQSSGSAHSGTIRIQRERRATITVVTVILAILICFLPYLSVLCCYLIKENCGFPREYVFTAIWLARSNCCVNPIIYGLMNNKFRSAFKEMLRSNFIRG